MTGTAWTFRRESRPWVGPITITDNDDGSAVTSFEVAIVPRGAVATAAAWQAPDYTEQGAGVSLDNLPWLPLGESAVLARVPGDVDDLVIEVGTVTLTL